MLASLLVRRAAQQRWRAWRSLLAASNGRQQAQSCSAMSRPLASAAAECPSQRYSVLNQGLELTIMTAGVDDGCEAVSVPVLWLRDHCTCAMCYDRTTNQRRLDTRHWRGKRVARAAARGDRLYVTWADGHESVYSVAHVYRMFVERSDYAVRRRHRKKLWTADKMAEMGGVPRVEYNTVHSERGMRKLIENILVYGCCVVSSTPCADDGRATFALGAALATPMMTMYGDSWLLTDDGRFEDSSYSSAALGAHTDGTYYAHAPGVQMFHVLRQADVGGDTLLVDGFECVRQLFDQSPAAFWWLARTAIPHHYVGANAHLRVSHQPVIRLTNAKRSSDDESQLDGGKDLLQLRYNPYDRAPLAPRRWLDVNAFYDYYSRLCDLVNRTGNEYWLRLSPGDCLFVDNWRVMHGRSAYKGGRVLAGRYLDRCDFVSRARATGVY